MRQIYSNEIKQISNANNNRFTLFQLGALYVLREITTSYDVRKSLTDLGGVPLLIDILSDQARDLQILASETLANVARIRKARMIVRKCGGIPKIVSVCNGLD